jgi:hypothetical protein
MNELVEVCTFSVVMGMTAIVRWIAACVVHAQFGDASPKCGS